MCVQNPVLGVKREGIKVRCGGCVAHHAQGLAECAADRDTAIGQLGWGLGA